MFEGLRELTGLAPEHVGLIALMVCFAAFVRGMTGFGMAIVLAPLLGLLIEPERAVLLNILLGALVGPLGYFQARRLTDKRQTIPFTLAAIAIAPFGLFLLSQTPPDIARLAIAAIALASFFVVVARRPAQPPPGLAPALATGAVAGLVGSFAGIPGAPVVYYFVRDGVAAQVSRASMIVLFFWSTLAMAAFAVTAGKISWGLAALAGLMLPALVAGNAIGERFFGKVDQQLWRAAVLVLLGASALAAIWRFSAGQGL